jgi:hypothetical protein
MKGGITSGVTAAAEYSRSRGTIVFDNIRSTCSCGLLGRILPSRIGTFAGPGTLGTECGRSWLKAPMATTFQTKAIRSHALLTAQTYDRLVALKDKYDPTNFFRMNHNIKPTMQPA